MNKNVKERTIDWLETTQAHGEFDGFTEENVNFRNMSDEEIEWYFTEWFFTDDFINDLEPNEIHECYSEELAESKRILGI